MRGNMKDKFKSLKNGLKIGAAVAAMALAVCVGNNNVAYADDTVTYTEDGGIKWRVDATTSTLIIAPNENADADKIGIMSDYSVFKDEDGKPGKKPAWASETFNNIDVKDGVKVIGNKAFGCKNDDKNGNRNTYNTVVLSPTVTEIGDFAFSHVRIDNLKAYSLECSKDSIGEKTFYSTGDVAYNYTIDIGNVDCYLDSGINRYFKDKASDNTIRFNPTITNFNLKITSDNLLSDNDNVSIKFDGINETQNADKETDSPSINIAPLFENNNMDIAKLKFFTLSQTDENAPINKADVSIPTPSDWKDNYSAIKLYSYTVNEGVLKMTELSPTTVDADKISYTAEGFPVDYVLYYDYNSNPEYKVLIDTQYFDNEVFYWGIAGGSLTYGVPTKTDTTISEMISKFAASNTANSSGYTIDNNKLKVFDLSLTVDGTAVTTAPSNMRVKVPVPDGWEASDVQVLTLSSENKITAVNSTTVTYIGSKLYVDFMPPHFSPYALYNAKAGTETTTVAPTTTASSTTAVAGTTRANTNAANGGANNSNNNGSGYNGSGKYDNTPKTGVKDFMWIVVPVAVMLMGTGMVILGRRKQKSIDE